LKINISIDDVTPHPRSSLNVLRRCEELRSEFRDIKFTLFVPTAYYRTVPAPVESMCDVPFRLASYPEFCRALSELPSENYEIAYHGHFHGIPGVSNNDELRDLSYVEAHLRLGLMLEGARQAGVKFKPVLRPPAWRMSPATFDAARDLGIRVLALSRLDYAAATYGGKDTSDDWAGRVVYADSWPPQRQLAVSDHLEVLYHACEWDANYLSETRTSELCNFLRTNEHTPVFIEELAHGKV
jgi:peptidoglycan/xylan/chitin deacetylase (PgdA/CDA1 family)